MRQAAAVLAALWIAPTVAEAGPAQGCDKPRAQVVAQAMEQAKVLALRAAAQVGDTADYERWFGPFDPARSEVVRASLKALVTAIRSGAVTPICEPEEGEGCGDGTYAWVYPGQAYKLHLCPPFFDLPELTALRPGAGSSEFGTREGTIIHELSHFHVIAGTEDHCYSRADCAEMAADDPRAAIENADSYQYFTEDVTWYGRQPIAK